MKLRCRHGNKKFPLILNVARDTPAVFFQFQRWKFKGLCLVDMNSFFWNYVRFFTFLVSNLYKIWCVILPMNLQNCHLNLCLFKFLFCKICRFIFVSSGFLLFVSNFYKIWCVILPAMNLWNCNLVKGRARQFSNHQHNCQKAFRHNLKCLIHANCYSSSWWWGWWQWHWLLRILQTR